MVDDGGQRHYLALFRRIEGQEDYERELQQRDLRRNFDFGLRQAATQVEQRMASYEQMLRAARGLFEASDAVSRDDFQSFVSALMGGSAFGAVLWGQIAAWTSVRTSVIAAAVFGIVALIVLFG